MCFRVFGKGDGVTVLCPELGKFLRDGSIHGRMSGDVSRVVRKRTQGKGILVDVASLGEQRPNKVAATNVMHQIAEESVAEWVIAQVMDQASAVGVAVSDTELFWCRAGILLHQ